MADFVLVHGAWHGGWCWDRVAPLLESGGHRVFTPTLAGLGERAGLLSPAITLQTHIDDVAGVLEAEDLRGTVLVGHSYGGILITAAADRLPERVGRLVYLDAFVPESGQSLLDMVDEETRRSIQERAAAEGEGWRAPPMPLARWGVTAEADVAWMRPLVGDHPLQTFRDPVRLEGRAGADIGRVYISCTAGQKPHYAATAARVRGLPGWRCFELPTGHDAMVTMPRELADLLLKAAS